MIIAIANEKGGSGKSTLACNLTICQAQKDSTLLIDTDPQKSIVSFLNIRSNENITKNFDFVYRVGETLKKTIQDNKNKYKNIIIDTGGRDSKEMRIAIALSDIVLIPTLPSQFDVSVLDKMVDIIKMAKVANPKLHCYILINRASTNPFLSKKAEYLKEYIKSLEEDYIKLLSIIIYEREKYKIATQMGLGVTELPEDKNKAQQEIKKLCNFIFKG